MESIWRAMARTDLPQVHLDVYWTWRSAYHLEQGAPNLLLRAQTFVRWPIWVSVYLMRVVVLWIGPPGESETTLTGLIRYSWPDVFMLWTSFLNIAWNPSLWFGARWLSLCNQQRAKGGLFISFRNYAILQYCIWFILLVYFSVVVEFDVTMQLYLVWQPDPFDTARNTWKTQRSTPISKRARWTRPNIKWE